MAPSDHGSGSNTIPCDHCGTWIDPKAAFCRECGTPTEQSPDTDHCGDCGREYHGSESYCVYCGAPRGSETETPQQSETGASEGFTAVSSQDPTAGSSQGSSVNRPQDSTAGASHDSTAGDPPGSPGGASSHGRTAVLSPQAFRSRVNEYLDYGWELTEDRGDEYDLQYRDYGGLLAHTALLLFFFTAVWGNALYAGYRWLLRSQEATVSADDPPERWPAIDPRSAGGSLHYVGAFVLVFPFLLLLYAAIDLGTNPFGWLTAIGTGLGVLHLLPPVRRRLHDRGPLSEFGRTKTTDESVVYGGHQCVDCGTFVDTALERSYQERFSIAGIPLLTGDEGENYYCEDCASPNASTEPPAAPDWNHSPRDPTTRGDEAGNHRASGSNHPPNTGSPASRATRQGSTDPTVSGADGIGDREPSLSEQTNRDSPTVASPPDETEFEWQTGVESNADEHSQQATPKTDAKASSDSADDERDDAENDWVV